jgi:hypothetical protein
LGEQPKIAMTRFHTANAITAAGMIIK